MKKRLISFLVLLTLLATACSPQASRTPATGFTSGETKAAATSGDPSAAGPEAAANAGLSGLNRDGLDRYLSTFVVQFDGPKPWSYHLKTRKLANTREISLHIDGITGKSNPGDVRMVTDGVTSRMIGAGTDNECVQFPNNQGMDPRWIYPESLLSLEEMASLVKYVGEEQVAGAASLHYAGSAASAGKWQNVKINLWQEKVSKMLLKMDVQASGEDPFFNTGAGQLTAHYSVAGLDVAAIEPVAGCEIIVPLPDKVTNFVRLPGMASFDSPASIGELSNFYQSRLPADNWAEKEAPAQADRATILSYQRGADEVEIHLEGGASGGSRVKLIFIKTQ
jgi:hypothetical protein